MKSTICIFITVLIFLFSISINEALGLAPFRENKDFESLIQNEAPVISSIGTKSNHSSYHQEGKFKEIINEIANELHIKKDSDGEYNFRKYLQNLPARSHSFSNHNGSTTILRIEDDDILTIIDKRFLCDHAGIKRKSVYARAESKAAHELAELRCWLNYARNKLNMLEENIKNGRVEAWIRNTENVHRVKELDEAFHFAGLIAENEFLLKHFGVDLSAEVSCSESDRCAILNRGDEFTKYRVIPVCYSNIESLIRNKIFRRALNTLIDYHTCRTFSSCYEWDFLVQEHLFPWNTERDVYDLWKIIHDNKGEDEWCVLCPLHTAAKNTSTETSLADGFLVHSHPSRITRGKERVLPPLISLLPSVGDLITSKGITLTLAYSTGFFMCTYDIDQNIYEYSSDCKNSEKYRTIKDKLTGETFSDYVNPTEMHKKHMRILEEQHNKGRVKFYYIRRGPNDTCTLIEISYKQFCDYDNYVRMDADHKKSLEVETSRAQLGENTAKPPDVDIIISSQIKRAL